MLTPERIQVDLLQLIERIRNPPAIMKSRLFLPNTQKRFNELADKCIELHHELAGLTGEDTWTQSKKLFAIEAEYKRLRARLVFFPAVCSTYFLFVAAFFLIRYVDISGFIKTILKVDIPERLIIFGASGVFLYFATSVLTGLNSEDMAKDSVARAARFMIRVLLAVFIPTVLVELFFASEGNILSVEFLAFVCGYSAKLVFDLLSKILEKCSKMLKY